MSSLRPLSAALLITTTAATLAACSSTSHNPPAKPTSSAEATRALEVPEQPGTPTTSPTASASLPDPCHLLTKAEAEQLTGVHMQQPDDTPARDASDFASCIYDALFTGPSGEVSLFVQHGIPHALEVDRAIHHRFTTVPGIGDQTLEEPDNQSIFIRKGVIWVYLDASNTTSTTLERAARLIASRLP